VEWDRDEFERARDVQMPTDLGELWGLCGGLRLYEDTIFQRRGLVVYAPPDTELLVLNREYWKEKGADALPGDLVFGRFLGSRERVLVRCHQRGAAGYRSILIVPETGPRSTWKTVAPGIEEFLVRFLDAHGEKYWEHDAPKELAEPAAKPA